MEYFRGGVFVECDEATYERQYKGLGFVPFNAPKVEKIIAETDETPETVPEVQPKRNYNKKK